MALTDENSPVYVAGFYQSLVSLFKDEEKIIEAFKTGKGLGWGDHHHYLYEGTERFFKPNYVANLTSNWIPALDSVEEKLKKGGAKVADVGCGHGASTIDNTSKSTRLRISMTHFEEALRKIKKRETHLPSLSK